MAGHSFDIMERKKIADRFNISVYRTSTKAWINHKCSINKAWVIQ